jgi:hypothetical protein
MDFTPWAGNDILNRSLFDCEPTGRTLASSCTSRLRLWVFADWLLHRRVAGASLPRRALRRARLLCGCCGGRRRGPSRWRPPMLQPSYCSLHRQQRSSSVLWLLHRTLGVASLSRRALRRARLPCGCCGGRRRGPSRRRPPMLQPSYCSLHRQQRSSSVLWLLHRTLGVASLSRRALRRARLPCGRFFGRRRWVAAAADGWWRLLTSRAPGSCGGGVAGISEVNTMVVHRGKR